MSQGIRKRALATRCAVAREAERQHRILEPKLLAVDLTITNAIVVASPAAKGDGPAVAEEVIGDAETGGDHVVDGIAIVAVGGFGHQYSHVWIDFHGIQDEYLRQKGIDLFENSRRATISQRAYAIENPNRWKDYSENVWGLTACDGPGSGKQTLDGTRQFWGYMARGAAATEIRDDGTIAPTAAAASIPFAPEIVIPAIAEMKKRYGHKLYQKYGFLDAFNPTRDWFDVDYLGIDQGPIVLMIENYRSGFVWDVMEKNPHIIRGLRRAGFRGGWLE